MILSKSVRKAIAWAGGYFWLPCPVCGEEFGGNEWDPENTLMCGVTGQGICRSCGDLLRKAAEIGTLDDHHGAIHVDIAVPGR